MKNLKKFDFASASGRSTHNWEKLLDGGIYQLTEGEDYTCKIGTFKTLARSRAKAHGLRICMQVVDGGVVLQAYSPEDGATDTADDDGGDE